MTRAGPERASPGAERELSSWKEIAAYLRVSIRTAQSWEEQRGLPVNRLPGGRGRVSAHPAALDAWKQAVVEVRRPAETPAPHARHVWIPIGLVLVVALVASAFAFARRGRPALFRVDQNTLIVSDAAGGELWRKQFPTPLHLSAYAEASRGGPSFVWFGDLDDDGDTEVLFALLPGAAGEPQSLVCYSAAGREKWRFEPNRTVATRDETFEPRYGIRRFAVAPLGRSRRKGIVVTSTHYLYYPCQVALLSPGGKLVREYWHSGHLPELAIGDPDGDGATELYLAGVNNARRAATLVVLDPDDFGGAARESDDYQLRGFSPGRERARVLFPRTCFNRKLEAYNIAKNLWAQPGGLTVAVAEGLTLGAPSVIYHLTPALDLAQVTLSDAVAARHATLEASRVLDHPFSPEERKALRVIAVLRTGGESARR